MKTLTLNRFKGHESSVFPIDGPLIVCGENGSGKSGVLAAVQLAVTGGVTGVGRQAGLLGRLSSGSTAAVELALSNATFAAEIARKSGKHKLTRDGEPNRDDRVPLLVQEMLAMTAGELSKLLTPCLEFDVDMAEFSRRVLTNKPASYNQVLLVSFPNEGKLASSFLSQKIDEFDARKREIGKRVNDIENAIKQIEDATPKSDLSDQQATELELQLTKSLTQLQEIDHTIRNANTINQNRSQVGADVARKKLTQDELRLSIKSLEDEIQQWRKIGEDIEVVEGYIKETALLEAALKIPPAYSANNMAVTLAVSIAEQLKQLEELLDSVNAERSSVRNASEGIESLLDRLYREAKEFESSDAFQSMKNVQAKTDRLWQERCRLIESRSGTIEDKEQRLSAKKEQLTQVDDLIASHNRKLQEMQPVDIEQAASQRQVLENQIASIKQRLSVHREVKAQTILRMKAEEQLAEAIEQVEPLKELLKSAKCVFAEMQSKATGEFQGLLNRWCHACNIPRVEIEIDKSGVTISQDGHDVAVLCGAEKVLVLSGVLAAINVYRKFEPTCVLVEGGELSERSLRKLVAGLREFKNEIEVAVIAAIRCDSDLNPLMLRERVKEVV